MAEGLITYDMVMGPDSWMTDEDLDFCAEVLNLKSLRAIDTAQLPDK